MKTFKPHDLVYANMRAGRSPRIVEIISHPIGDGTIKVRMVPGDPSTMETWQVSELKPCLKYRYVHIAEVKWSFGFPEDMLRYDDAWFCSTAIDPGNDQREPVRIYCLRAYKRDPWTHGRWQSFSATCKPICAFDLRSPETKGIQYAPVK